MKNLLLGVFILLLFPFTFCYALETDRYINARAYSMGKTASVISGFLNPATSGYFSSRYFSMEYLNRYGVKELSSFAVMLNYPNNYLNSGVYFSRYGFDAYNEQLASINFYKKLSPLISLGGRVNYLGVHYSDQEQDAVAVTGDMGILLHPVENLHFSLLVMNPLRSEIKMEDETRELANVFLLGLSYQPESRFLLTTEIEKDFNRSVIYKLGMEYTPIKQLSFRTGMWTKPFTPSFGVGIKLSPVNIDLAFSNHPVLGFNSCCALQFNF
ncbi:hypothetical protein [Bacteroides sedimenti]|uniref:Type IX secretion system membrane protein PorP/SprF n=1 Tax=Bacteroides sedimenti TaxID=2136147 RepID=A0ABN6ZC07_9BACE